MPADIADGSPLDRAELSVLLLDLWEDLAALRAYALDQPRADVLRATPEWATRLSTRTGETSKDVLKRWAVLFHDELETVQALRNAVAHAQPVPEDALRAAVNVAGHLMMYARLESPNDLDGQIRFQDERIAKALKVNPPRMPGFGKSS